MNKNLDIRFNISDMWTLLAQKVIAKQIAIIRTCVRDHPTASCGMIASRLLDQVTFDIHQASSTALPSQGGLLDVSNHPTHIDGIILAHILGQYRNDTKIIVKNGRYLRSFLALWPSAQANALWIDPNDKNLTASSIHAGINHLKSGGSLVLLPSGRREVLGNCFYQQLKPPGRPWLESWPRLIKA